MSGNVPHFKYIKFYVGIIQMRTYQSECKNGNYINVHQRVADQ